MTTRRRTSGQSLVEMALLMPILFMVVFGIIDLSYYIFGYATIYQAARNGSEIATQLPPYPSWLSKGMSREDPCVHTILAKVEEDAGFFPDIANFTKISYPLSPAERRRGQPIEVTIDYQIEPLTPLFQFVAFGNNGTMRVQTTSRRSIENTASDPSSPNGVPCKE